MKKLISALAGTAACCGLAQAQTSLVDTTLPVPTYYLGEADFTVAGPAVFTEDASTTNSGLQGIGFLTSGGNILDVFALTNGSVGSTLSNTISLTNQGSYQFLYDFANANGNPGTFATLSASVTTATMAAPEIDPASMGAAVTLLVGGLLVLQGRRRI